MAKTHNFKMLRDPRHCRATDWISGLGLWSPGLQLCRAPRRAADSRAHILSAARGLDTCMYRQLVSTKLGYTVYATHAAQSWILQAGKSRGALQNTQSSLQGWRFTGLAVYSLRTRSGLWSHYIWPIGWGRGEVQEHFGDMKGLCPCSSPGLGRSSSSTQVGGDTPNLDPS